MKYNDLSAAQKALFKQTAKKAVMKITLLPIGFGCALTLLLVYFKATTHPEWSWFLVFAPVLWWLYLILAILAAVAVMAIVGVTLVAIVAGVCWLVERKRCRRFRSNLMMAEQLREEIRRRSR